VYPDLAPPRSVQILLGLGALAALVALVSYFVR
jgi:hypothetical protein